MVMDNLNIHCRKSLTDYFGKERGGAVWNRLTVHYTPKQGSWLNQTEIEISLFSRQCLGRRRIATLGILRRQSRAWNRKVNRDQVKINWGFTRKRARAKFGYERNSFRRSRT
jgi:nuclear transport factor 2 (NTF2) superfamily protein